jgi:uncharacterized membrane protein
MPAKFAKQSTVHENAYAVIVNLVGNLGVKVSASALRHFQEHPDYPSLSSISETLLDWGIESLSIFSTIKQLKEIPYPAIAHLNKYGGHFVVLEDLENGQIHYSDPEIGIIKESVHDFEKKWTGVLLLVHANEKSGEENYKEKRRQEVFKEVSAYLSLGLLAFLFLLPLVFLSWSSLPFYLLKVVGVLFSFALLQKQFGGTNAAINAFCSMGSNGDCDSVINSPASKLFGVVHLSEIGAWYFSGGVLSMIIGSFATYSITPFFFLMSIVNLPFSLLAIYYQGMVIKKWCPLCLAVMGILWLEFVTHLLGGSSISLSWIGLSVAFVGFSIPLVFWLSIRQSFLDSLRLPTLERKLTRFLKSDRVFQKLLADQPFIDVGTFYNEIQSGSVDAPVTITAISNPVCGPCAFAHFALEDLLERFEGKLKIVYRFVINGEDTQSVAYKMLHHLIEMKLDGYSEHQVTKAISSWYTWGKSNIERWKAENTISEVQDQLLIKEVVEQHLAWCSSVGFNTTPTILINGKKLPEQFSIKDLKFQLRKLVEVIELEPTS